MKSRPGSEKFFPPPATRAAAALILALSFMECFDYRNFVTGMLNSNNRDMK
jgi:hypothetical protein